MSLGLPHEPLIPFWLAAAEAFEVIIDRQYSRDGVATTHSKIDSSVNSLGSAGQCATLRSASDAGRA
jgi:hypothetical protein